MKNILMIAAIFLSGCASTAGFNNTQVLVQKEYVVRTAPDTLKTLPPLPPAIANPQAASNNQVAAWINSTEEYIANLESMIQNLVNFYEKPVNTADRAVQPQSVAPVTGSTYTDPIQRLRSQ